MPHELTIGFLPLVDACLPILAHEHGFAEEEGVSLRLVRDVSWATVLDRLLYGHSDAAHMVAPLAIATTLGRGRPAQPLSVPFVLGLNGNAITLRPEYARRLRPEGTMGDAAQAGAALRTIADERLAAGDPLRFGVVHRYSSHNYMLRYWLAACGIRPDEDVEIATVAPPFCADALAAGEVDGICVGEPWNSVAVEQGAGEIVLATAQIWRRGVEKVLTFRTPWLEENPDSVDRLIRALARAAAWCDTPDNHEALAHLLSQPHYVDQPAEMILRALSGGIVARAGMAPQTLPDFMLFSREATAFPWRSQALWIYSQLVRWKMVEHSADHAALAGSVFRPDIFRRAMADTDMPLPGASMKVEGAVASPLAVGSKRGGLTLGPDRFFDGRLFDPERIEDFLAGF